MMQLMLGATLHVRVLMVHVCHSKSRQMTIGRVAHGWHAVNGVQIAALAADARWRMKQIVQFETVSQAKGSSDVVHWKPNCVMPR